MSEYVLVCAIDFGTTFSGYAFSFRNSPEDIKMNKNWGDSLGFQSYKTSTSVLFDGREFKDFGFDAETAYGQAVESKTSRSLHLYRHFKMMLHKTGGLTRSSTVASADGTIMPATKVFSCALQYLKDHMIDAISKTTASKPHASMIRWVITVPAIWRDESKQFMREAALNAGIITNVDSDQLVISLEPEAASLFCRRLDVDKLVETSGITSMAFAPGTKYIVIDAGGGTVDITAHQIMRSGGVKELHSATGGAWGGTQVDKNFENLLCKVLGASFLNRYKQDFPQQFLTLMINFEKMKKGTKSDGKSTINISVPWSMGGTYSEFTNGQNIEEAIKKNGSTCGVHFINGNLVIDNEAVKKLFDPVTRKIVAHVENLLRKPSLQPCKFFFLVGGFSESAFLQRAMLGHFGNRVSVLIPSEAQMSVIKGAVLFGHTPTEIQSRIATRTYGCRCAEKFIPGFHDESKRYVNRDGKEVCGDIFEAFVNKGDEIKVGTKKVFPLRLQSHVSFCRPEFYALNRRPYNPQYITEEDVISLGTGITIQTPNKTGAAMRYVDLEVTFGGTEIKVNCRDRTSGRQGRANISFLTD